MLRRTTFDRGWVGLLVEDVPTAYRDTSQMLKDAAQLVTPVLRLTPIVVLKR